MAAATTDSFKPQDFSRFLIREFLKKKGFDKTYDQFMLEDDRPKVTMTKNELMRLLGIESLMKRNTKIKQFDTMLDIICDFLMISKEVHGGVEIPCGSGSVIDSGASTSSTVTKGSEVQKKQPISSGIGSVVKKPQTATTSAVQNKVVS